MIRKKKTLKYVYDNIKKNINAEYFTAWLRRIYDEKPFKKILEQDYSKNYIADENNYHTHTQFFKDFLMYRKKYKDISWQIFVFSKKTHKTYFCSGNHVEGLLKGVFK